MGRAFLWPKSLSGLVVVFALTKQILWPLTKLVKMFGRYGIQWAGQIDPLSTINVRDN